jgi:non-specific serine/threonine protein kinase/serine/threonine-protein kinase
MRLVTPEYASPEQVSGDSVTTASDIYSLGVLLYLLLTGMRPYDFRTRQPEEIGRIIGSQIPERPSLRFTRLARQEAGGDSTLNISPDDAAHKRATTPERLRQILAEDLDNIVLKALRKEPERRYSSVEALSDDIRRHLEGLPVFARPDTIRYRSRKFVRRHRMGVVAASLVALSLCGGIAATLWQSRIAIIERARAEAGEMRARSRSNEMRRLTQSLMFELYDSIGDAPAATPARALLAARTVEYLDSLTRETPDDVSLQSELVIAYINLGDVQGNPFYPNMGDPAAALVSYQKAADIAAKLARNADSDASVRRRWWRTQLKLADISIFNRDMEAAARYFVSAQNIIENLVASRPEDKSLRHDLGTTYDRRGNLLLQNGDAKTAVESYRQAQEIFEQLSNADRQNDQLRRDLANGYGKIGDALIATGDFSLALENFQRQVELNTERLAAEPSYVLLRYAVASNWGALGDAQERLGERADALQSFRRQLMTYNELAAVDPENPKVVDGITLAKKRINQILARRT